MEIPIEICDSFEIAETNMDIEMFDFLDLVKMKMPIEALGFFDVKTNLQQI